MSPLPTVAVAQLVESQIVILVVAGSSPVGHPIIFCMKYFLSLLGVFFLAGCVVLPSKRVSFNDIKIGMPRDEAVKILGEPYRVSAKGSEERLFYHQSALYIGVFGVGKVKKANREFELRVVDGKVESFGKLGEQSGEGDPNEEEN